MSQLIGPDSALVTYRPVIEISDSKKNEDAVTLKTAGSFGSTEFTIDEVVTVYQYIKEFLQMHGLDPDAEARANQFLDKGFLGDSLQDGESLTISGGPNSFTIAKPNN